MPARFKVGEQVGPSVVVFSSFVVDQNGHSIETMRDALGNGQVIHRQEVESYDTTRRTPRALMPGAMRVVVPHTVRHPDTQRGLSDAGLTYVAEWVELSENPFDYWNLLRDYWLPENNLLLVEHDVEIRFDIRRELETCAEPWCYFRYSNHTPENAEAWHWGILGCTRFRKELIAEAHYAPWAIEERFRDWHEMSTGLGMVLRDAGFKPHMHEPAVRHHRMIGGD